MYVNTASCVEPKCVLDPAIGALNRGYSNRIIFKDTDAPQLSSIRINGTNQTNATIHVNVSWADSYFDRWYFESNLSGAYTNVTNTSLSLSNVSSNGFVFNVTRHQSVGVRVYGFDFAGNTNSTSRQILVGRNNVPEAQGVGILPSPALDTVDLNCSYTYYDRDADAESGTTFRWFINGSLNGNVSKIIGHLNTTVDDQWRCEVTPNDSFDVGISVNSSALTVGDSVSPVFTDASTQLFDIVQVQGRIFVNVTDRSSSLSFVYAEINDPDSLKTNVSMGLNSSTNEANVTQKYLLLYTPLKAGTYGVKFWSQDTSGNLGNTSDSVLSFLVGSGSVGTTGGGGGGSSQPSSEAKTFDLRQELASIGVCNNDGVCGGGESPWDCSPDCGGLVLEEILCIPGIFEPGKRCVAKEAWFFNVLFIIIIGGFGLFTFWRQRRLRRKRKQQQLRH